MGWSGRTPAPTAIEAGQGRTTPRPNEPFALHQLAVPKRRSGSNCDTAAYTCHVRYCSVSDIAGGKHSAADVVAKAQAVLSEPELLRAMFNVGYFPPNTPPDN